MRRPSRRTLARVGVTAVVLAGGALAAERAGLLEAVKAPIREWVRHHEAPRIEWETVEPAEVGLDRAALDSLRAALEARGTRGFLVAREGAIAYEWYAEEFGPNLTWLAAAATKGLIGSLVLGLAIDSVGVDLDHEVSRYIPEWAADSLRSRVRLRHLAFHSSGLEDVDFIGGARGELDGWKARYYENPPERFRFAIDRAPIRFEPGARYEYSGVGYYVLAYALARALADAGGDDLRSLVRDRLMRPLGIPDDTWIMSYGHRYRVDDLTLFAIGSGGSFSLRGAARLAQLVMDRGRRENRRILEAATVDALTDPDAVADHAPHADRVVAPWGAPAAGWFLNSEGAWPSLPRDALATLGDRHQIVLIVPSWDLVAVRLGAKALDAEDVDYTRALVTRFLDPLAKAVRR